MINCNFSHIGKSTAGTCLTWGWFRAYH